MGVWELWVALVGILFGFAGRDDSLALVGMFGSCGPWVALVGGSDDSLALGGYVW